ncbi:MAG: ABC transporter permease [Acidobacteriia bacterium]|nr:ABC transporter permease [Terriglobia bacterium]
MWKDLAFAVRTLRRSPLFTAVAVLSLALGIGANTAIFSLLDQVALRSLPVADPARLTVLHTDYQAPGTSTSDNSQSVFSCPMYRDLRDRDAAFSGVVARMGAGVTLAWQGNAEQATAELVSGNFFATLGVGAAMGRVLAPEDDGASGAHPVIVLGHSYWSSRFANSPAILNQAVILNGHPVVVIGVVEARFHGLMSGHTPDMYVPIAMQKAVRPTWDALEDRRFRWLNLFARLRPGIASAQAQAATDVLYRSILETELARIGKMRNDRDRDEFLHHRALLQPAAHGINALGDEFAKPLWVLMAMVGLVLVIACGNVANLMLARAAGRQREIAIRLAMGAGRWSLAKQLLTEGVVVALAGGALGLLVAAWSSEALLRLLPKDVAGPWLSPRLSLPLLGFNLVLSFASGLLFALVPALQATRPNVAGTLKDQAANVVSGGGAARLRKALVTAQVALSLLLAVGAGLFASSLVNLMRVNLGFRTERLLMFSVNATLSRPDMARAVPFYRDLEQRLAAVGGVAGVGAAEGGPFSGSNRGGNLTIEGYNARPDEYVGSSEIAVSPGFFRAMGIPLRAGREFSERDDGAAPKVVVINETFARRYFAGRDAIGRRLMMGSSNHPVLDHEIVGVAADSHVDVRKPPKETFFFPYAQWDKPDQLTYYVRTAGDESRLATDIRQVVRAADANVPTGTLTPMDVRIRESIYTDRLIALLSGAFGLLATLLAAIGLYGVVAYAVTQRTAEIGIRIALGAPPAGVLRMILLEAGRMAGAGIAIGVAAALAIGRLLESQLFGIQAANPSILAAAALLLAAVALVAALVPGWRASRIDPISALKYE